MIKYDLNCDNGHAFDGWFKNSTAFEDQKTAGYVSCPFCHSTNVDRALMAPNVQGTRKSKDVDLVPVPPQTPTPAAPNVQPNTPPAPVQNISAAQLAQATKIVEEQIEIVREFKKHVTANSEDVGDKFAEEARKIHYKESDPRGIRGHATPTEAKELKEEGVDFIPLPVLPEEMN